MVLERLPGLLIGLFCAVMGEVPRVKLCVCGFEIAAALDPLLGYIQR